MTDLKAFLISVGRAVDASNAQYSVNFAPNILTHPIPFFGNVESAKVVTVGVNPSVSEFKKERWAGLTNGQILGRLINYFNQNSVRPHPWFEVWEKALQPLGCSYTNGTAAHADLSPRA